MQVLLVLTAAASFAGAVALPLIHPLPSAAHLHLALSVGVMPLIFGAMIHFVPVLTRGAMAGLGIRLLPMWVLAAGLLAFFSFAAPNQTATASAAIAAFAAAVAFLAWAVRRASSAIGKPHPCLWWYVAAIGCLMLALLAVLVMPLWPEQRLALKNLHLHLNTLGFIGLTAIGTLQVLLPTAAGRPDREAAMRLHVDLKWALGGTLLISLGAAWFKPLAYPGVLLWMIPLARLAKAWLGLYLPEIRQIHGATSSLAAALAGFFAVMFFGAMHAMGILSSTDTAHAFILAFLFPLVTGAVSQLLPIWAKPGMQTLWHERVRQRLGKGAGYRALLFFAGGILLGSGWRIGLALSVAALVAFLLQLASSALISREADKQQQ